MPSSISLPSNEELEQILGHLDANNRDTWIMVFNALGKDYPNNDTVFKIAQNWASHAGNRKKTDEKHEKNEFYKGNHIAGIGAIITAAQANGYRRVIKKDKTDKPEKIDKKLEIKKAPSAVTKPKTEEEQSDYDKCASEGSYIIRALLYSFQEEERQIFLSDLGADIRFFVQDQQKIVDAVRRFCFAHRWDYKTFISWAKDQNIKESEIKKIISNSTACSYDDAVKHYKDMRDLGIRLIMVERAQALIDGVRANKPLSELKEQVTSIERDTSLELKKDILRKKEIARAASQEIAELSNPAARKKLYVTTGYSAFDERFNGFRRGETSIICAYSGAGKTWLGCEIARRTALAGLKVAMFSAEMSAQSISFRMMCTDQNITQKQIMNGYAIDQNMKAFEENTANCSLTIMAGRGMSIYDVENEVKRLVYSGGLDLLIIDYFQILEMKYKGEMWERNKAMMQRLVRLSEQNNLATLAFVQLSRPSRQKSGQTARPSMYDIAGGSGIVHDVALSLIMVPEQTREGQKDLKRFQIDIAKSRYCQAGDAEFTAVRTPGGGFNIIKNAEPTVLLERGVSMQPNANGVNLIQPVQFQNSNQKSNNIRG